MEDTLRVHLTTYLSTLKSLNPCSNGRDSQRANEDYKKRIKQAVLILVLMEDTLRVEYQQ